ncbi:GntR family transcriptional regulator [Shimia litoralis]|uniref:GntR family transcriptional regulator n=1 Tax=Shimia litoralis TaxID=420403 RepID=A0A4V6F2B6_9RHOB|nr:GntR family transcriptional regulator [Shimia litoralis]TKZ22381.1 GntR family transcriptional regulator [Shimia litoralis]
MKLQTVDIGKTASAASLIFEAVRKAIIEGDLNEGEALRQDELARMFNTSRIPVREALTMLEQQGLVKIERYKGAIVAGLSLDETNEIFDFRALVEPEVIRSAVPQMTQSQLRKARGYIDKFARADDPMAYGDLNRKFHATLYQASKMTYHMNAINNSIDRIDRYVRAQLVQLGGMERANQEHRKILEACEKGDANLAAQLTADHIIGAKTALNAHFQNAAS